MRCEQDSGGVACRPPTAPRQQKKQERQHEYRGQRVPERAGSNVDPQAGYQALTVNEHLPKERPQGSPTNVRSDDIGLKVACQSRCPQPTIEFLVFSDGKSLIHRPHDVEDLFTKGAESDAIDGSFGSSDAVPRPARAEAEPVDGGDRGTDQARAPGTMFNVPPAFAAPVRCRAVTHCRT